MALGIRKRVVISCAGYDVTSIVEPVKAYSPDIVITLHDMFSDKSLFPVKSEIIGTMQSQFDEMDRNMLPMNFECDIHDFSAVSSFLESAVERLGSVSDRPDIFINISAGTNEFAAAATMCAMLHDNVSIFSVRSISTNLDEKNLRAVLYKDGIPTGVATEVSQPEVIQTYDAEPPERHLVLGLRILVECSENGPPMAKDVISRLITEGVWLRDEPSPNDNVFYLRDFVDKWIDKGWVEKGQLRNRYSLTNKGKMVLDTFYKESDKLF